MSALLAILGALLLATASVGAAMSFSALARAIETPDAVNIGGLAGLWAMIIVLAVAGSKLLGL